MVLGTGAQDFDSITDVDTIAFTTSGTVAITTTATGALDGINEATSVTLTGGNSISTLTLGGTATLTSTNSAKIDLSGFNGALSDATFAGDAFDNGEAGISVQVIGTANADTVSASYDAGTDAAVSTNMQGVETFDVDLSNSAIQTVIDMALTTGLTRINLTDTSAESVQFSNLAAGVTVDVLSDAATATTAQVVLADATGSADSQTFVVDASDANDGVAITTLDIETLNISSDTADQVDLELANVTMTTASKSVAVNFTGTNDIEVVSASSQVLTIDASGMGTGGAIVQTGRTATAASTYTGSAGADTFIMMATGDVLDSGTGADTLDINYTQAVGTAIIDLTQTDQISSLNGGTNSASQKGFQHVDLAGLLSNGAVLTGDGLANTLVGSGSVDQIDGGAGVDTITGGGGNDNITTGAGADIIKIVEADGDDTITDFTAGSGGDVIDATGFEALTTDDTNFSLQAASAALDVGVLGVTAINTDAATADGTMTKTQINAVITGTKSGSVDSEVGIVLFSTDVSTAQSVFMYAVTSDGTDVEEVSFLGQLDNVILANLTADNFDGYA
jgi:Ca2+-binding RTX toxin-like protein